MRITRIALSAAFTLVVSACATSDYGYHAFNNGQYDQASKYWNPQAQGGDPVAQYNVGLLWHNGYGSTPQDFSQAMAWYMKSAEQGYALAMNNIGVMYHNGHGVERSTDTAITWYTLAARHGDSTAQSNLTALNAPIPIADLARAPTQQASDSSDSAGAWLLLELLDAVAYPLGAAIGRD